MKKIIRILCMLALFPCMVHAAGSASLSAPSSVEVGSTVKATLTLKGTAAWNVKIVSAGSTSGCTQSFADSTSNGQNTTKTLSVTCKATSLGMISFTATGDITSKDGVTTNVSASKRVTVVPVREKATDANLASLSIEGYTLTPAFNKDTLEYSVTVPSTVNSVKIAAKANESHASVSGTGEVEVSEGINTFNVVVTAESGATKTYVVNVNVEDTNPIEVKIGKNSYTVIKNGKSLPQLNMYEEKTIEINGFTIPAFYSETTGFTLVGLKDNAGKVVLAIYNEEKEEYLLYNEVKSNFTSLYLIDFPEELKNYTKSTITINEVEVPIYRLNENSRFVICYGMNIETGKYDYYSYDTKEGTFQVWNQEEVENLNQDLNTYMYVCIAFGVGLVFAIILILCLLKKKSKHKKNAKKNLKEDVRKQEKEELVKEIKVEPKEEKEPSLKEKLDKFDRFDIEEKK